MSREQICSKVATIFHLSKKLSLAGVNFVLFDRFRFFQITRLIRGKRVPCFAHPYKQFYHLIEFSIRTPCCYTVPDPFAACARAFVGTEQRKPRPPSSASQIYWCSELTDPNRPLYMVYRPAMADDEGVRMWKEDANVLCGIESSLY
jgi:hypothetical protein